MIKTSGEYKAAIIGDTRRMLLKAIVDIIDPDIVYGSVESRSEAEYSRPDQIHNKETDIYPLYATLERNRWALDGRFKTLPSEPAGEIGYVSGVLSNNDGSFFPGQFVELQFSNVSILQACSVYFPNNKYDGVAEEFTIEVKQGGTAYFSKKVTGNTETFVSFDGFTVNNPDAIRVTVTKWSKPFRRMRVPEIVPGIYEIWTGNMIASFSLKHQGDVSCVSIPYGTCTIKIDNLDRRFEPRRKGSVFQSIEERQGIPIFMGPELPDGTVEYMPVGVFYQYSSGWKTSDNNITIQWSLVDIIGLVSGRDYIPPDVLPTTLKGWVASIVAQLGESFSDKYTVDPNYADLPLTAETADMSSIKCGDLLRDVCMATGTWPRADAKTGYLAVEPLWDEGNKLTLDNLTAYPTMSANTDLAAVVFTLNDGSNTQYVVSGNATASSSTVSVKNPFIKTKEAALTAARQILSAYGGNKIDITGRGDPSSEIGDVDTVWLDESSATTARRIQQDLSFQNGVLMNCKSTLLQADGAFLFSERAVITSAGSWTAPVGVKKLRLILVEKGKDGEDGTDGTWDEAGEKGADGSGGLVWSGSVDINEQQVFQVAFGEHTTFGQYSSANGAVYQYGYTDIQSGESYGRTGVKNPLPGSGDGGAGGAGGKKGNRHVETVKDYTVNGTIEDNFTGVYIEKEVEVIDNTPGDGQPGVKGASGCVVVYWDKEAV